MRHRLTILTAALTSWLMAPARAAASDLIDLTNTAAENSGFATGPEVAELGVATIVGRVVSAFLAMLGVIFVSYVIYGGWQILTAGGNDEHISKAKLIIRNGIVGLIIILSAWAIYTFVYYAVL